MYKPEFSKTAQKDAKIAGANGFKNDVDEMIAVVRSDPFEPTPGHRFVCFTVSRVAQRIIYYG